MRLDQFKIGVRVAALAISLLLGMVLMGGLAWQVHRADVTQFGHAGSGRPTSRRRSIWRARSR